ncbi:helix-turn-helix domain-containing protein [Myroides odoratimimus]|uniref:AraC family transcriptional regulator n=1 Tax=Myroides TaxID=76831 RepID=UPI0008F4D7C3|nr:MULTISPECIES: helix-turn-helix transcriptional regulator [Myroides]APA93667.1 AraC family transcriptional regulator [Myroides sp. ZB35]MDM1039532.1 helix-turn-helix domain-containing protein [Myroides odoratimimus]MDM1053764.1 helix-turn-helix domain-containing protein [Myroides odoratimimus]MDM1086748.1 helix-turn-helix domain-containing protein [Myroides odoratimimus]MDM1098032.1 helix-turn-helix domain-containing protein [Myroides odoratimimus]
MNKLPLEPFLHRFNNRLYINCKDVNKLVQIRDQHLFYPHKLTFFCIHLFLEGQGTYYLDSVSIDVAPKRVLIVSKNQVEQYCQPINYKSEILMFTEEFFCIDELHFQFFYNTKLFDLTDHLQSIDISGQYEELTLLFTLIKKELNKSFYPKQQYILNNYLFNTLLILENAIDKSTTQQLNISHDKLIVSNFKHLVNNKIDKSMTVKMYASELKLSVRSIEYAFKKTDNITPYAWVSERMIMEIKRLLLYKDLHINEISFKLKFKEANHLTVFFKRKTGLTPLQFRNKYKENGD